VGTYIRSRVNNEGQEMSNASLWGIKAYGKGMSRRHVSLYLPTELSGACDAVDTPHSAPTYAKCDAVVPVFDSHSMLDSSALSAGW
jgi:hypothetical protein